MKHRIIPFFLPNQGCPFHCIYCDQQQQTGKTTANSQDLMITRQVEAYVSTMPPHISQIEIAFFGGTFTGLSTDLQTKLLDQAVSAMKIDSRIKGIRLSTHPLMINAQILDLLSRYPITMIELGIQSFDDTVLKNSARGYASGQAVSAFSQVKEHGFSAGIQLMTGLPADSGKKSFCSTQKTARMKPDCVRIYPTVVFQNTPLARLYREKVFQPDPLKKTVSLLKKMLLLFSQEHIPVIRVGIHPVRQEKSILAGPYHPSLRSLCEQELRLDLMRLALQTGFQEANICFAPEEESFFRGQGNKNVQALKKLFPGKIIRFTADRQSHGIILDKIRSIDLPFSHLLSLYEEEVLKSS